MTIPMFEGLTSEEILYLSLHMDEEQEKIFLMECVQKEVGELLKREGLTFARMIARAFIDAYEQTGDNALRQIGYNLQMDVDHFSGRHPEKISVESIDILGDK
jgi:hypothetical protein